MDLAFEYTDRYYGFAGIKGFNPCFSGSCIRIYSAAGPANSPIMVSILVLVDLAFEFVQGSFENN